MPSRWGWPCTGVLLVVHRYRTWYCVKLANYAADQCRIRKGSLLSNITSHNLNLLLESAWPCPMCMGFNTSITLNWLSFLLFLPLSFVNHHWCWLWAVVSHMLLDLSDAVSAGWCKMYWIFHVIIIIIILQCSKFCIDQLRRDSGKSCHGTSNQGKKVLIPNSEELLHQCLVFSVAFDEIL